MGHPWYEHAVFYGLDIEYFQDSNGDGRGDIRGLIQRLDYLQDLGITGLWLLPFYPSSNRDNDYDITDYLAVAPPLGTLDDFRELVREAHKRNIRILVDLVVHHTSDKHPWFQAARTDPNSPYRDRYIWTDHPPDHGEPQPSFPGPEQQVWTYDDVAQAYYFHLFYHFQPDLNIKNPQVQEAILEIARIWLAYGVDGFRLDAANHMFERKGLPGTEIAQPCDFLTRLHQTITSQNPEAMILAEADVEPDEFDHFTCNGQGIQLFLSFYWNNVLFLALARERAQPLIDGIKALPRLPAGCSWLNFLRNLDELDLERLSAQDRADVLARFAPDDNMRIYGRGARRRLAPLLNGNPRWLKFAFSLLLAQPGPPLIMYGDEIGMGDNLGLPERQCVRLPMQWSTQPYGGFTTTQPGATLHKPLTDGQYGCQTVNVAAEDADSNSLLSFIRRGIRTRTSLPVIVDGTRETTTAADGRVMIDSYTAADLSRAATIVHNFSHEPVHLPEMAERIAGNEVVLADDESGLTEGTGLRLGPYGFYWLATPPGAS